METLPYLSLRELLAQVIFDVAETFSQRIEGVAGANILLDDKPLAARSFGCGDNAPEIQIAGTNFGEGWLFIGGDGVILDMQEG